MRRMSYSEYNYTVHDLFPGAPQPALDPVNGDTDTSVNGFRNNASVLSVSQLLATAYNAAATSVATYATANMASTLPCDPSTMGQAACAGQFIATFGARAYRRPLSSAETQRLTALYTSSSANWGFSMAIQLVIQAILQSPYFLYRPEFGEPAAKGATVVKVGPYERASRLSYLFWESMPDEQLMAAAAAGQLETPAQITAQAQRMLKDPKALRTISDFHAEWLGIAGLSSLTKDSTIYPQFGPDVPGLLANETQTFISYVFSQGGAKLDTLFTAPYTFANKELAQYYGLTGPTGTTFEKVALDPTQRAGLLTQGSVMATYAHATTTSPVKRGAFIRKQILCQELAAPPPNVNTSFPPAPAGQTTRQELAAHASNPQCSGCHDLIDPPGLAFENFDGIGRWRSTENGLPIDPSGQLTNTVASNDAFAGPIDLIQRLLGSDEMHSCVVTEWFRYTQGRTETPADGCTLQGLDNVYYSSQHDLQKLLVAITQSDAFLYREVTGP